MRPPFVPPAPPAARVVAAVTALALALRAAAAWRWAGEVGDDVDLYRGLAAGLLAGRGFADPATGVATAFRPPLVPLMYAALGNAGWAILLFQTLAGAATAGLTVRLGTRLGLTAGAAGAAGLVVACDPVLLRYASRPMTETVCALLAVGLLCRLCGRVPQPEPWLRLRGAFMTGALFGLCCSARPTFWAFGGLLAAGWAWDRLRGRAGWLYGGQAAAAAVLGIAAVVAPWAGRNWAVFGKPIAMTTHGGYTLHLANNEVFYDEVVRGPAGAVWGGESLRAWQTVQSYNSAAEIGIETVLTPFPKTADLPPPGWVGLLTAMPGGPARRRAERVAAEYEREGMRRPVTVRVAPPILKYPGERVYVGFEGAATTKQEPARDRWHRDAALAFIKSDPVGFARAAPLRVSRFWGVTPLGEAAATLPGPVRWAVGAWNAAVFVLAACGAWRALRGTAGEPGGSPPRTEAPHDAPHDAPRAGGSRPSGGVNPPARAGAWRTVLLLPVAFTAVHAVYWSNARMRGPVVPAVAVLAAAGLAGLTKRFARDGGSAESLAGQPVTANDGAT